MKYALYLILLLAVASCTTSSPISQTAPRYQTYNQYDQEPITASLFEDETATISEENIQKILDGDYALPKELRVALVKLEGTQSQTRYYWNDETYLKSQQAYLDSFTSQFKQSDRVQRISKIPDLLLSDKKTFTNIREAAVRTQSDIVVVYTIYSDLYAKYKLFAKSDIKAFATTQLMILDVRTGLIPFTTVVTREYQSKRKESELSNEEAANRIKKEAILLTIQEIGKRVNDFLETA
ncbi:MAG: hypothetical protein AAF806_31830 [Bacteroidota bacterium]